MQLCLKEWKKEAATRRGKEIGWANSYSVFLLLWRATNKLLSEAGYGEVTNPK